MKKILIFNGSPRKTGNISILIENFRQGALKYTDFIEEINPYNINLEYCTGCLRCNLLKRCSISKDEWTDLSKKIMDADVLVFGSPVYFHHVTAPLKKIIDRFRSFVKVQITETGLIHTPHNIWNKEFVLILSMGSPDTADAKPIVELFNYITEILGKENRLHVIEATRLGVVKQIDKTLEELENLYEKMEIPVHLSKNDFFKNILLKEKCFKLGEKLSNKQ